MRFVYVFVAVILIAISVLYWFVISRIDFFQYRAVRVGYTRFYQLMDSLFNEFRNEEDDEISDMFEAIFSTNNDEDTENDVERTLCSWQSLNALIAANHERVMNTSRKIRKNPKILQDRLVKDLEITNTIFDSYNNRMNLAIEQLPPFLLTYYSQLSAMLDTVNDINRGFQNIIGDAIQKIDYDQFESHKSSCVRLAKILQQFEMIIQSQNEEHLQCGCDVAMKLDELVENFANSTHFCVIKSGEDFSNYMKEIITPIASSMEISIRAINRAMKRSKTSVEVFYQLPMSVSIPNSKFVKFTFDFTLNLYAILQNL